MPNVYCWLFIWLPFQTEFESWENESPLGQDFPFLFMKTHTHTIKIICAECVVCMSNDHFISSKILLSVFGKWAWHAARKIKEIYKNAGTAHWKWYQMERNRHKIHKQNQLELWFGYFDIYFIKIYLMKEKFVLRFKWHRFRGFGVAIAGCCYCCCVCFTFYIMISHQIIITWSVIVVYSLRMPLFEQQNTTIQWKRRRQ